MGIKIKSIKDSVKDTGIKVLVHGEAGAGKTVMGATAKKPTLIISAESGLLSIAHAPEYIDVVEVKTIDDVGEVYDYLALGQHEYDWVVLDSISEIGEVLLSAEKRVNKDPRAAYGNLIDAMTVIIKKFRDLPMNVMMTCKQDRKEDQDTGRARYAPSLPGARLANEIPYLFDIVGALRVETDKEGNLYRVLQTGTDMKYVAKDRSGALEMFEEPSLAGLMAKIHPNGQHIEKPAPVEKFYYVKDEDTVLKTSEQHIRADWVEISEDDYNEFLQAKSDASESDVEEGEA
jgi:phage nucleotide-binding protein